MSTTDYTELDAALAALGIDYKALFVPQSFSRNSEKEQPSLNWRVTIARGKANLATDYSQGIGHVVGYCHSRATYEQRQLQDAQNRAAVSGTFPVRRVTNTVQKWRAARPDDYKQGAFGSSIVDRVLPPPALRDVMYSLLLDSEGAAELFEDWAGNFGYDTDSRKAEAIYRACQETAARLAKLLTPSERAKLQELFQDY